LFLLDAIELSRYNANRRFVAEDELEIVLIVLLFLIILALGTLVIWQELRLRQLSNSFRRLMTGRGGTDLESALSDFVARMDHVERSTQAMESRVGTVETRLPHVVQHVGVVRFNPFADKGGDQSFAMAILDDQANGAVISTIHSRVEVRVYAKPVIGGQSTYTLTAEEKDAIARAMMPR
jgi:hypothetical protein